MKKRNLIIAGVFVLAIGSALASNSPSLKFNTVGYYWDATTTSCEEGESTFTCSKNNLGQICTDNVSGGTSKQLRDGTSTANPCGDLIKRPQ